MEKQPSLSLFHFLFCELIEECCAHSKEDDLPAKLAAIGANIGFQIYNYICLKRGISERPSSIIGLIKNIQTKVFKHLFNYEACNKIQTYEQGQGEVKSYIFGIIDETSVYLTWIPDKFWYTAALIAGIIEGICNHSGLKCSVTCRSHSSNEDKIETQFLITVSEEESQKWKISE